MKLFSSGITIAIAALHFGVLVDGQCYGCPVETITTTSDEASTSTYYSTYPTECTTEVPVYETPTVTVTTTSVYTKPGETVKTTETITTTETLPPQTVTTTSKYITTTTELCTTTVYKKMTYTTEITKTDTTTTTDFVDRPTTIVSYQTITEDGTTKTIPTTYTTTEQITVPSPTTEFVDRPTTIIQSYTVTQNGTTEIRYSTITQSVTVPSPTTITDRQTYISETTSIIISLITLPASTTTVSGSVITQPPQIITSTITQREPITITDEETVTEDRPVPTTVFQTVISGFTSLITLPIQTTTIIEAPSTITTTLILPGTTSQFTVTQSGTTFISTVTLPGSTSVQVITQPGPTLISTITIPGPAQTVTQPAPPPGVITSPPQTVTVEAPRVTSTAAPSPSVCTQTGYIPVSDSAGCGGRDCQVEFQEGAVVHWSNYSNDDAPPLQTAVTFINRQAQQTCITTSCNTEVFNQKYYTSLASCARPPCPSNSIDCNCNIVVGPLVLPGGQTTSVTQIGPSGWNLNLGPVATANDVGLCSAGGPQCVTSTTSALSTPVIYTGDASIVNATGALPVQYLLPGISNYFAQGNPFGACTTVRLNAETRRLRARQEVAPSVPVVWKGSNSFIPSRTEFVVAEANVPSTALASTSTAQIATTTPGTTPATVESPTSSSNSPPTTAVVPEPTSSTTETPPTGNTPVTSAPTTLPSASPTSVESATSPNTPPQTLPQTGGSAGPQTQSESVSSVIVPGSSSTNISGTIYVTNTVYYSMIYRPEDQSIIQGVSSLRNGASTVASSDFGAYVTSLLGLNSTSGTAGMTSSAAGTSPARATGAAPGQIQVHLGLAIIFCLVTLIFAMQ